MATYFVILKDGAYKTAQVVGVHVGGPAARRRAQSQADGYPDIEYYRPTVITETEKQRHYPGYSFYA